MEMTSNRFWYHPKGTLLTPENFINWLKVNVNQRKLRQDYKARDYINRYVKSVIVGAKDISYTRIYMEKGGFYLLPSEFSLFVIDYDLFMQEKDYHTKSEIISFIKNYIERNKPNNEISK